MMSRRVRLTPIDLAAVVADYEAGVIVRRICEEHHIGLARMYRILDDHHTPRREPNHGARTPEAAQDRIARAYQAGEPVRSIADRHGVCTSTVSNIARRVYRQRVHVRHHDELVALIDRWFAGEALPEADVDAITRAGVRTRRHGLAALAGLDPALGPAVVRRIIARLRRRTP